MNEPISLPRVADLDAGSGTPEKAPPNPLLILHRCLRGRYTWAVALGIFFGVPLSIAGYYAMPPTYTSVGIVRVHPTLKKILYDTEENKLPPLFDSFVAAQAQFLQSRRILDMAVTDDRLREVNWPTGGDGVAALAAALTVDSRRGNELIIANVKHQDGLMAQRAVNAVLAAYETVQDELSGNVITDRESALDKYRKQLLLQIDALREQMVKKSEEFGSVDLADLHRAKLAEMIRLESALSELNLQIESRAPEAERPAGAPPPDEAEATVDVLALRDARLSRLVDQKQGLLTEISALSLNVSPEHRRLKELKRQLEGVEAQITERVDSLRAAAQEGAAPEDIAFGAAALSRSQLVDRRDRYLKLKEGLLRDALRIERSRLTIEQDRARIADLQRSLDETNTRLEQTRVENQGGAAGRVQIVQRGDLPVRPSTDRRKPLAAMGFLGGAGLGVALVALFGLTRSGYRYIDEIESDDITAPLLGTVPDLRSGDLEHESLAALSVHHLRNMLQIQVGGLKRGAVYSVTSAAAGDGKTSLAIALGMSFAAAGSRTILVDSDLVGRGMTRQLGLVAHLGVCEAIAGAVSDSLIHATQVDRLWAMPAGLVDRFVPEHLSGASMNRVLEYIRDRFDVAIVDTGPVLGSLEANIVAPASDRVLLVVSRGQSGKFVKASLHRLRRLGAVCAGLVFNRAGTHDFDRSASVTSVSARSIRGIGQGRTVRDNSGRTALLRALGPKQLPVAPDHRNGADA